MPGTREITIYIHGIDSRLSPVSHKVDYTTLHQGIESALRDDDLWPRDLVPVEWGWPYAGKTDEAHTQLSSAQAELGTRVLRAVDQQDDFMINPARLVVQGIRRLMIHGFSDMFYYVSQDGKGSVREAVTRQILYHPSIREAIDAGENISMTILGHSAGSVIALDFLYYLFHRVEDRERHEAGNYEFLGKANGDMSSLREELSLLQGMARSGQLRVRRLVTFGSPITAVVMRSNSVVRIFNNQERLHPADYGLLSNPVGFGPQLPGPRWLNIWDADDTFAWPVAPLFEPSYQESVVADRQISVSLSTVRAHSAYWRHEKVQKTIARFWRS